MAAIIAAVVAAVVSVAVWGLTARRDERQRKRDMFAQAFAAYASYREFPYVVRRRRVDQAAEERQRISEELRKIQEKLNFFLAWTRFENAKVGSAYADLVATTRTVVGAQISAAWNRSGADDDTMMLIGDIDLSGLERAEEQYMTAVSRRLAWWRL
jgi:hypothetical protein